MLHDELLALALTLCQLLQRSSPQLIYLLLVAFLVSLQFHLIVLYSCHQFLVVAFQFAFVPLQLAYYQLQLLRLHIEDVVALAVFDCGMVFQSHKLVTHFRQLLHLNYPILQHSCLVRQHFFEHFLLFL